MLDSLNGLMLKFPQVGIHFMIGCSSQEDAVQPTDESSAPITSAPVGLGETAIDAQPAAFPGDPSLITSEPLAEEHSSG